MSETDEEKNQKFVLVKWLNPRFFQSTCTLSFLECYSLGLHQKLCNKIWQQFQLGTWTILPKWRFSESFSSRLEHGLPKLYFIRSFILEQVKRYTLQVYFVRLLIKIVTLELNTKHCHNWYYSVAYLYEHWDEDWNLITLKHIFCLKMFP